LECSNNAVTIGYILTGFVAVNLCVVELKPC
jgi:hypothetical protein